MSFRPSVAGAGSVVVESPPGAAVLVAAAVGILFDSSGPDSSGGCVSSDGSCGSSVVAA